MQKKLGECISKDIRTGCGSHSKSEKTALKAERVKRAREQGLWFRGERITERRRGGREMGEERLRERQREKERRKAWNGS